MHGPGAAFVQFTDDVGDCSWLRGNFERSLLVAVCYFLRDEAPNELAYRKGAWRRAQVEPTFAVLGCTTKSFPCKLIGFTKGINASADEIVTGGWVIGFDGTIN